MGSKCIKIEFPCGTSAKIIKWKVEEGTIVNVGRVILLYGINTNGGLETERKLKSTQVGTVTKLFAKEGDIVQPGSTILELEECTHPTVFKDMCAECGIDLRKDESNLPNASVPMVHSIPELKVSEEQAQLLGKADVERLLKHRKLVLLVDLDQTLIHTTNDNIPANLKDVYHFRLHGSVSPWYHTRLRPGTHRFLTAMDRLYELHICTFGARNYAHMIAMFLDQDGKFFSHRILSRDECFNPNSKTANLKALFPCGDNMVCIIDDREDVWNYASNLIHVKPYHFFKHTGDINAPPGLAKRENDDKEGFDFNTLGASKEILGKTANKDKTEEPTAKAEPPTDKETISSNEDVTPEEDKTPEEGKIPEEETGSTEVISTAVSVSEDKDFVVVKSSTESKDSSESAKAEERTPTVDSSDCTVEPVAEVINSETSCETEAENGVKPEEKMEEESEFDVNGQTTDTTEAIAEEKGNDKSDMDVTSAAKAVEFESDGGKADDELVELDDDDDYLLYLEEILKMIHKAFFKHYDKAKGECVPDMKDVIPEVRSKVLSGVHMVFSGLVPTHVALEESRAYLVAVSLGATVEQDLTPQTTHLVAVRPGTAKVNAARNIPGLIQVTPKWLWSCAERWEHTDERLFPLSASKSAWRHPPAHCTSPEHVSSAHGTPAARRRTPSGRFMDSINPLLSFSTEEIAIMDREVEDMFNESESDSESPSKTSRLPTVPEESVDGTSSSSASLGEDAGDMQSWGLKRPASGEGTEPGAKTRCISHLDDDDSDKEKDEDSDSGREKDGDEDSDSGRDDVEPDSEASVDPMDDTEGDWNDMGAALEREFLSE